MYRSTEEACPSTGSTCRLVHLKGAWKTTCRGNMPCTIGRQPASGSSCVLLLLLIPATAPHYISAPAAAAMAGTNFHEVSAMRIMNLAPMRIPRRPRQRRCRVGTVHSGSTQRIRAAIQVQMYRSNAKQCEHECRKSTEYCTVRSTNASSLYKRCQ